MIIIVKKYGGSSKGPAFKPHYNRELGKKYYSERDYRSDMKKAGLEPYNPNSVTKHESKPYKQSAWAKEMLKDISNRNGRKPGERFIKELAKRGYTPERAMKAKELANASNR